jgi:hypothetical protein
MEILVYLWLSGTIWIFGLAFVVIRARRRLGAYTALSLLLSLVGLTLYLLLSMWMGLFAIGTPYSVSIPHDYIARGAVGIATLLIGITGIVSPAFAAWVVSGRSSHPTSATAR